MKINQLFYFAFYCLFARNVQAIDLGYGFTLKGFGTGGLVNSSSGGADFVANTIFQPAGAGWTNDTSLVVDSKLGMQLSYQATDRLSFTAQGLSKQQYNKSFTPVLEWAFAKFKIIPDLEVRAGRIRPAIYMLSDYLDVNYANPWIRPPVEFYTAPLDRMEGLDFLWRPTTGNISWLIQPYFGVTQLALPRNGASIKSDNILGINVSATYSNLTLRAGFSDGDLIGMPDNFNDVLKALNSICQSGFDQTACTQYNKVSARRKNVSFSSFGLNWDNGDYFVMGEFGKRTAKTSFVSGVTTWYVSSGAHIQKFTPYLTYSNYHNDSPATYNSDTNLLFGSTVNQIVTGIIQANAMDQHTISLGLRYDFMSNLALKGQWDHIQTTTKGGLAGTGRGLFVNQQPGFGNGPTQVDVFSVSLDFVF
ncbi:hypothetical protein [Methylomonas sp. AM2-LC]|uniref:hypothetical protein n=1 Tax=Methylomonas sp. AM2-LC TaxID=3153301 RepID=UPI003265E4BA